MARASKNTGGMKKDRVGRAGQKRSKGQSIGGCQNGMPRYRNKAEAAASGSGAAFRCGYCNDWHNEADRRRRGKKPER